MKVAEEKIVPNIPKTLFLEFENKEVIPVAPPIKFMKNWPNAIAPTTSSAAEAPTVTNINRKNINPKIENIKEIMLKAE